MKEPSVLDYVKSKLMPWKYPRVELPASEQALITKTAPDQTQMGQPLPESPVATAQGPELEPLPETSAASAPQPEVKPPPEPPRPPAPVPWRSLAAIVLALVAQRSFEPPDRTWQFGAALYILAFVLMAWAFWTREWVAAPIPEDERLPDPLTVHRTALLLSIPFIGLAFLAFGGGLFNAINLLLWLIAIVLLLRAFWLDTPRTSSAIVRLRTFLSQRQWNIKITRWALLLAAVAGLAIFFHGYRLSQVPAEMNSDHAEKLLDVSDVLHGEYRIFFPRNTGREAIQFYLTAAIASLLGTGVSFLSLKIGTMLCSLVTLPFIYLLGKEVGNRQEGLFAVAFAAIGYWPDVITRLALRFTLYPLFVAPTLYYLVRGIRRSSRNDFILSGIFLGIGLHGYTPIRILPFVVVVAVGLYLLHRQSKGVRRITVMRLAILALVAFVFFLPLFRYAQEHPDLFAFRAFSRVGTIERPLPGPAWQIFLSNTWNAMISLGWDNGEVWTVSIPHRPALDVVSAALFYLGYIYLFVRYLRQRHWLDLFLILSVPMLMLPSILSLAFPSENPVLSRTGGALVTVFVIVGVALNGLYNALHNGFSARWGPRLAVALVVVLFGWSVLQNYDLVFNQYDTEYKLSAWNTSEMGQVIRDFADSVGSPDSAWVMGYPYWVDTRLVGMNAGYPTKDYAMFVDQLGTTKNVPGAKLFIVNLEDTQAIGALQQLYPRGWFEKYASKVPSKDFLIYFVPVG
jgi:hypothetical protein